MATPLPKPLPLPQTQPFRGSKTKTHLRLRVNALPKSVTIRPEHLPTYTNAKIDSHMQMLEQELRGMQRFSTESESGLQV